MTKKWVCPVCGYVYEGENPPEKCPQCKVPGKTFKEMANEELNFVTEHKLGVAKDIPETEEGAFVLQGLKDQLIPMSVSICFHIHRILPSVWCVCNSWRRTV